MKYSDGVLNKILIQEHDGVLNDYAFRNHFDKIVACYNCNDHVFLSMICSLENDEDFFVTIVLDWVGSSSISFAMALYHGLKFSYGLD